MINNHMTTKPLIDLSSLSIYLKQTTVDAIRAALGELDYVVDRDYWIYTDHYIRIKCRNNAIFNKIASYTK